MEYDVIFGIFNKVKFFYKFCVDCVYFIVGGVFEVFRE